MMANREAPPRIRPTDSRWSIAVTGAGVFVALLATLAVWYWYGGIRSSAVSPNSMTCDMGISTAKNDRGKRLSATPTNGHPAVSGTAAPVLEKRPSSHEAAPLDMVWIPGGEFWMGADDFPDAQPWHRVSVDGFWMDRTEVTNEQFERFVKATGYVTTAERTPRPEDFPHVPPDNLVAGSVVFTAPDHPVALDDHSQWWSYGRGTDWRHPEGPQSSIRDRATHPVVHISYTDALNYAQWAGKRLPTEAEFEFAQRGGLDRKPYAWGDEFRPKGKLMANTFQGRFPDKNTAEDGYATAAPVASFPPNDYGLYDMTGNVWEWTSDWYRQDYYHQLTALGPVAHNPQGPPDSFDPSEPGAKKRVHKGGSFLCNEQYCARYIAGGRGKGDPDTSTNHLGFRTVIGSTRSAS